LPEKHPPKASTERGRMDPWGRLKKRPGVKILDVAHRRPRER